jgi:hypothetical protein
VALTQAIRDKIIRQEILVDELSDQQLADFCITLNTAPWSTLTLPVSI